MAIIALTSTTKLGLEVFSGRTDSQLRDGIGACDEGGLFIAESMNVIQRALDVDVEPHSFLVEEQWLNHEMPLVEYVLGRWPNVPIYQADHDQFTEITGYRVTRGALACFHRPAQWSLSDLCTGKKRVALIENVTNYTNIGQMFRSAAALGIDAIVLSPQCHDPLYRRAARVSMGTVFQIPWCRVDESRDGVWPSGVFQYLKTNGFTVLAMALTDDALSLDDPLLHDQEKLAILLGTEGEGLSQDAIALSDHAVVIPMHANVDSLNVGAAAAVAFWELRPRS